MPQLRDELAQLVGIPGVSEWDFPELATPANLMVMEPGGYRFSDYWKLGLPLLALFGLVAVLLVPATWSL